MIFIIMILTIMKIFIKTTKTYLLFKQKKFLKESKIKIFFLFNKNLIVVKQKGNLIVYSLKQKKIISKYNFYKKKVQTF